MSTPVAEKDSVNVNLLSENKEELISLMREVYHEELKANGKKVLSLNQMTAELKKLPSEADRDYELAITRFSRSWADSIIRNPKKKDENGNEIQQPPTLLQQLYQQKDLRYGTEEEKIAFAAYAVAVNYERLQKNSDEEGILLKSYKDIFGKTRPGTDPVEYEHVFYFHLDVLYRMDKALGSNDDAFLMQLLKDSEINSKNLVKNYGGHHAFAETTALVFENATPELRAELEASSKNWLSAAYTSVQIALAQHPTYAKFHCTLGRLHALRGDFVEAIHCVNRAIALEDNTRSEYSIRIGQYSGYYQQIRAQQRLHVQELQMLETKAVLDQQILENKKAIDKQMQDVKLAMDQQEKESMSKNMEFLGLFSGIVSFTIGSLTITGAIAEQSIKHAVGLIIILMGALMCVFAAFGMILHGFRVTKKNEETEQIEQKFIFRHLVVFGLGIVVVAGGVLFCLL